MLQTAQQTKVFPGVGKFDPTASTYRAEMYLLNGRKLDGYSKSKLYPEAQDKIVLLEKWIERIYRNENKYFSKMIRWEFYLKNFSGKDDLIFTLYPTSYQMGNHPQFALNERLVNFFSRFYKQIQDGQINYAELIDKPQVKKEHHVFSLEYRRFKDGAELHRYTIMLAREGWPHGRIMDFSIKYTEKYLSE